MYKTAPNKVYSLYGFTDSLLKDDRFKIGFSLMILNWLGCGYMGMYFTAAGDSFIYWNTFIQMFLNAVAIGLICIMPAGIIINLTGKFIGKGISNGVQAYRENSGGQSALPSGEYANPLGNDILMVKEMGETVTDYLKRIEDAKTALKPGVWIVCLWRGFDRIVVESSRPDECRTIPRSMFDDPAQPMEYPKESKSDFEDYLSYFAAAFQGYSISTKFGEKTDSGPVVKMTERPILKFMEYVRASAAVVLFLLLSVCSYGQATAKIHAALGDNDKKVADGAKVHYVFTAGRGTTMYGDGELTVSQLYDSRPGADGKNIGEVEGVSINGVALPLQKVVIASNGTAQKPAALFADATGSAQPIGKSFAESLPDSATVANGLNNVKHQLPFYKSRAYQYISPVIEFCTFLFFFLAPLFGIGLGFSRLIADSAKENGNLGEDVRAQNVRFSRFSWYLSIILVGCIYLCATFSMFFWEFHPIGIAVAVYLLQYPAKWGVNFLTSNGQFRKDQKQKQKGGGYGQPQIDR